MKRIVARAEELVATLRIVNYYPDERVVAALGRDAAVMIGGREHVNFGSNSYLHLHAHPDIVGAAHEALDTFGLGAGGSRITSGTQSPHVDVESRIARFKRREACAVFSTGYNANVGILSALAGRSLRGVEKMLGMAGAIPIGVFSDELNHASIIDGLHLARALNPEVAVSVFRHRDMEHLEDLLERSNAELKLIVTDGVFSLHGRLAPLDQIVRLANAYNAEVYVDDAHGLGVLGATGRGTAEHFGVHEEIQIPAGTLSKAIGGQGGYVLGSRDFCDYIRVAARSYMFQTAMPAAVAAAITEAFDVIEREPWRREVLARNAAWFRGELTRLGFDVLGSETQIVPVRFFDVDRAKRASGALADAGMFAPCYYYPAVKHDEAQVRLNLTAGHTQGHLERALEVLADIGRTTAVIPPP